MPSCILVEKLIQVLSRGNLLGIITRVAQADISQLHNLTCQIITVNVEVLWPRKQGDYVEQASS